MQDIAKEIRKIVQLAYQIMADWLYAAYWQLRSLLRYDNPKTYAAPERPQNVLVIIIPGIYEPWQFMQPLIATLYAHRYQVRVVEKLGYNTRSIPEMAAILQRYIAGLNSDRIVLVGHSKGGLIGKYMLANYNQNRHIRHVIAINAPFSGSIYAQYAPMRSIRLLASQDPIIQLLHSNKAINSNITSIYSAYDPNIPGGSRLAGATNIALPTVGHFRIIASTPMHKVITKVLARINKKTIDDVVHI